MRKTPLLILSLVMLLAGLTSATAGERPVRRGGSAAPEPERATTYRPLTVMGTKLWIDPETGQMAKPTAEEAAQLSARLQEFLRARDRSLTRGTGAPTRARTQRHANGMVSTRVDASLLEFSVVRKGPDGRIPFDCVDGPENATALSTTPLANQEEE